MTRHLYTAKEPFPFEAGGSLDHLQIVYHCSDRPYAGPSNPRKVIWVCHALTANSDPEDWWPEMAGPGKLFDTEKFFVVCCNMIGSSYGSSGPATTDPVTGKPYFFDFPATTVRDLVRSQNLVREDLGIPKIDLLIGASIGGFQAVEWLLMYPDVVRNAVLLATLARITPWLTAFEESQRMALEADQTFRACQDLTGGREGLKCARSIALLSYRNGDGYNRKQQEPDDDTLFACRSASYQRYQGQKLADRFDAYSYWYLSNTLDSHNAGRGRGGLKAALGRVRCRPTVIAIDSDLIFPPGDMQEMARAIPGARYHEITSHYGHDGFLLETDQLTALLKPIINEL